MANHIDYTYFINQINVPNAKNNNPAAPIPNGGELDALITDQEPKFLECLFGYAMYKDYSEALVEYAEVIDTLPEKWKAIRVGSEYTSVNGVLRKWKGFVNTEKNSPIANYVYVQLLSHRAASLTGIGTKGTASENSVAVSPIHKQVPAWNSMVDMNIELHNFILANKEDYPNYIGLLTNPIGCGCHQEECNVKLFAKRNTWNI